MNRKEKRGKAVDLLEHLGAAYLRNIAYDNRTEVESMLHLINNSNIDWEKDVVNSLKERYKELTSPALITEHMQRAGEGFYHPVRSSNFMSSNMVLDITNITEDTFQIHNPNMIVKYLQGTLQWTTERGVKINVKDLTEEHIRDILHMSKYVYKPTWDLILQFELTKVRKLEK